MAALMGPAGAAITRVLQRREGEGRSRAASLSPRPLPRPPMADFKHWKEQRLSRADGSRKGSVDEPIAGIVSLLNGQDSFCTTSSCSGRLVLLQQPPQQPQEQETSGFEIQKQNCTWLMVTHQTCTMEDVLSALQKATDDAIFKFEPFVLHVQCQELRDAQLLHTVAIEAGFRNSGITVGRKGKIMMAVRSTHCLEVPLSQKGKLMVSEEYVDFVVHVANQKMEENKRRIGRFYSALQFALKNREHSFLEEEEKNIEAQNEQKTNVKEPKKFTFSSEKYRVRN